MAHAGVEGELTSTAGPRPGRPAYVQPRRLKRSEALARQIVEEVLGDGLEPGDVLPPENDMLKRYDVGRATLREALRLLESQGLVSLKPGPGGGPVMSEVDAGKLGRTSTLFFRVAGATYRELCEAMITLQPWLAGLAANRRDPAAAQNELEAVMAAADAVGPDREGLWRTAPQFHDTLYKLSGNLVLSTFVSALGSLMRDHVLSAVDLSAKRETFLQAHHDLANAVIDGDVRTAEEVARLHVEDVVNCCEEQARWLLDQTIAWD